MNDTVQAKHQASFYPLKTILSYFPTDCYFKADLELFHRHLHNFFSVNDLKKRLDELSDPRHNHGVLIRDIFTRVYCVDPEFIDSFTPTYPSEDYRLILEDMAQEILQELRKKGLILKKEN